MGTFQKDEAVRIAEMLLIVGVKKVGEVA